MATTANKLLRRRLAAAMAGATALAVLTIMAAPLAYAEDDDEVTFEQSIIRSLLGGGNNADIDYRERSPLVIPPSRDLPPPASGVPAQRNAAWPQDPDVRRGRAAGGRAPAVDPFDRAGRPLPPSEIRRGAAAGAGRVQGPVITESDGQMGRPLTPAELGETRSIFGLIGSAGKPEAPATFTGEPTRRNMTDPPPGYRTPSTTQPYAPPKSENWIKVPTFFDRGVPNKDQ